MILHADAAHIPLADRSVQCVVTSPPYWGLRSYPVPPSIWGGESACEHEWGDPQPPPLRGPGNTAESALRKSGLTNPAGHLAEVKGVPRTGGAWCSGCGAWRGQLGLEPTPELYVQHIVAVFREVWRVLRDDGTVWLNLGDSYVTAPHGRPGATTDPKWPGGRDRAADLPNRSGQRVGHGSSFRRDRRPREDEPHRPAPGLKSKDLVGVPWRAAFALQADGWTLRSDVIEEVELYCPCGCGYVLEERIWRYAQDRDIVWKKLNPMPESTTDRPTRSHEYLFMLSKSRRYYYDADAIKEPASEGTHARIAQNLAKQVGSYRANGGNKTNGPMKAVVAGSTRKMAEAGSGIANNRSYEASRALKVDKVNKRSVWTIAAQAYSDAHFSTFPEALVEPCVLAGAPVGGVVCDPFAGSGTVGQVCHRLGRRFVGLELAASYLPMARRRTAQRGLLL